MKFFCYILLLWLLLQSCASQSPLTGGNRDNEPPKLIKVNPPHQATNIKPKQLDFEFNEFIQLRSLNQKLIVSPPLKYPVQTKIKPKGFSLLIQDTLISQTTYQFYFADAIVDLNEGNPLSDFTYVFSTGSQIDSLSVKGKIADAISLKAESQLTVCLYTDTSDSVVFKQNPNYVTRSNSDGFFTFNFLKEGLYKMVAFADKNNNYRFDPNSEKIAFLDSTIQINRNRDSIFLFSFSENRTKQYIKKTERKVPFKATIVFNTALEESPKIEHSTASIYQMLTSKNNDTLLLFFADSTQFQKDTILVDISYLRYDSLLQKNYVKETKALVLETPKGKPIETHKASYYLPVKNNVLISAKSPFYVRFSEPTLITNSHISLWINTRDSLYQPIPVSVKPDSTNPLLYSINCSLLDGKKYRLILELSNVRSYYNKNYSSDTIVFSTYEKENFGTLKLTYQLPDNNHSYLFELLNDKNQVLHYWTDHSHGQKVIDYLLPGNYSLRCIRDDNRNGKWDNGFYILKRQPEKVFTYPQSIQLRANWDMEIKWVIN